MAQITEKELTALGDLMNAEATMAAKYQSMAANATDKAIANCYEELAARHKRHLEELYVNLK